MLPFTDHVISAVFKLLIMLNLLDSSYYLCYICCVQITVCVKFVAFKLLFVLYFLGSGYCLCQICCIQDFMSYLLYSNYCFCYICHVQVTVCALFAAFKLRCVLYLMCSIYCMCYICCVCYCLCYICGIQVTVCAKFAASMLLCMLYLLCSSYCCCYICLIQVTSMPYLFYCCIQKLSLQTIKATNNFCPAPSCTSTGHFKATLYI